MTADPRPLQPVDPSATTLHEGRLIGFCCHKCKGKFEANPAAYLAKLPELKQED